LSNGALRIQTKSSREKQKIFADIAHFLKGKTAVSLSIDEINEKSPKAGTNWA
jgi:hypothetical protein